MATAVFILLAAVRYFTASGRGYAGYTVTAERSAAVEDESEPIDVNAADREMLERIPGIGAALASRIVAYREQYGPFQSVEELVNVSGIGERTLEEIRPYITVGNEP